MDAIQTDQARGSYFRPFALRDPSRPPVWATTPEDACLKLRLQPGTYDIVDILAEEVVTVDIVDIRAEELIDLVRSLRAADLD